MATPSFPLLKLPFLMHSLVTKLMTVNEQLHLSLLSKRTKKLVQCVPQQVTFLEIHFQHKKIEARSDGMDHILFSGPDPLVPSSVTTAAGIVLEKPYDMKDWVCHLTDVLKCKSIRLFFEYGSHLYPLNSLDHLLQGLSIIRITIQDTTDHYSRRILQMFPDARELLVFKNPMEQWDDRTHDSVLSRHLDYFRFGEEYKIGMDRLLRMRNCRVIEMCGCSKISVNDLNGFVKTWISNSTNQNLEILTLVLAKNRVGNNYQNGILAGVPHSIIPRANHKMLTMPYPSALWEDVPRIVGQYEVQRVDGKNAIIQFDEVGGCARFKFVVGQ